MLGQLGLMDPLQLRFTELCIEKRRMLNEMADLGKQAKGLRSELHRFLDCYMELVDVEAVLADDDWSDGDVDEVAAAETAFSEYNFLGDSDEETLIEQDCLPYLLFKEQQAQLARQLQKSPKRKRSRSPRRENAVTGKAGPEYPIVVGRAINRITINSLGRLPQPPPLLAEDPSSGYQWHPRGYESKRKYVDCSQFPSLTSISSTPKRANYICRCDVSGSFSISLESNNIPVAHGTDPAQVWKDFLARFPATIQDTLRSEFPSLTAFFGLDHEATKRHLRLHAV